MYKSVIHTHQTPPAVRAGDMANLARFKQIMGKAEAIMFCPPS